MIIFSKFSGTWIELVNTIRCSKAQYPRYTMQGVKSHICVPSQNFKNIILFTLILWFEPRYKQLCSSKISGSIPLYAYHKVVIKYITIYIKILNLPVCWTEYTIVNIIFTSVYFQTISTVTYENYKEHNHAFSIPFTNIESRKVKKIMFRDH